MLTDANVLNRKLEEVYGVGKEFSTVAQLWGVSVRWEPPGAVLVCFYFVCSRSVALQ